MMNSQRLSRATLIRRTVLVLHVLLLETIFMVSTVRPWGFDEHAYLGEHAYRQACEEMKKEIASIISERPPNTVERGRDNASIERRFGIACLELLSVEGIYHAEVFGEAVAIAGDHIADPNELISAVGGRRAASSFNYGRLALNNSTHFHPGVTREWARYHDEALLLAAEGAAGLPEGGIRAFERAFFAEAMADHFLQDSFAAGHMGFNRPASSAAASLAYHDRFNIFGRLIRNGRGDEWKTFGDGCIEESIEGEEKCKFNNKELGENSIFIIRVREATQESVKEFLRAYIFGDRQISAQSDLWELLPAVIGDRRLERLEQIFKRSATDDEATDLVKLRAILNPARVGATIDLYCAAIPDRDEDKLFRRVGCLYGSSTEFDQLSKNVLAGYQLRSFVGLGVFRNENGREKWLIDTGLLMRLGMSPEGLINHEFGVGFTAGRDSPYTRRVTYGVNLEFGKWFVRAQAGPVFYASRQDLYVGLGLGYCSLATGGGSLPRKRLSAATSAPESSD